MAQEVVKNQVEKQGPGRRVSKPSKLTDFFVPTNMNPALYQMSMILHSMPDPDEIMAKGDLHYQDLANLERDGHISSCIQQRKSQTLSRRIRVEPGIGASGPDSEKAERLCKRMMSNWGQKTRDTIAMILDALLQGMQPFELNWFYDNEIGGLITERPIDTLQEWFRYTPDGELRFRPKPWTFDTKPIPPFKILMARNFPSMRNPYGKKLLSACYWPVTFKRAGFKFFAEYTERFGMPTLHVDGGSHGPAEVQDFVGELIRMARLGVIATRGGYKVTMDDMSTKYQTTNMYDSFMATCDKESAKALLGQTLTTDEGGSRAQGDIHKQILETLWKSDDEFVAGVLTDLFDMVTYVNFGAGVIGPVACVGEEMGNDRLERDCKLRDMLGVDFSDEYLSKNYGLRPGDFVRTLPLKASYAIDPSIDASQVGPSGTPVAGAEITLKPGFIPKGGSAGAPPAAAPPSRVAQGQGGARKSEASKTKQENRDSHRKRGDK